MKVHGFNEPYHHIIIDDFLPEKLYHTINNELHQLKCEIPSVEPPFKRFSEDASCVPLLGLNPDILKDLKAGVKYVDWNKHDYYVDILFSYLTNFFHILNNRNNHNFKWNGYFEIGRDSFHPHEDNAWENLRLDDYYAGIIKGVLYFANENVDYTNYGTILLNPKTRTFVKELEFKANRLILFDTRDDSTHGTDYHGEMRGNTPFVKEEAAKTTTQLKEKRFTFNIEYCADQNLTNSQVESLYNKIKYPNARMLEWWINHHNSPI